MKRLVAGTAALMALAVAAPASADPGSVGVRAKTQVSAEGFGAGIPSGFGDFWNDENGGSAGTATSSYNWPPPTWSDGMWGFSCPADGCAAWHSRARASVDLAAGQVGAYASASILTGGFEANNAGYNQTRADAEIDDTITLSAPATVRLEGRIRGELYASHSHIGWYGDPDAELTVSALFSVPAGPFEEVPWQRVGGLRRDYTPSVFGCPYPSTCVFGPGVFPPGPTPINEPFSIEVDLPAGTSYFNVSMSADIDILVWGAQGDVHRSWHGASALLDSVNSLEFQIVVPGDVTVSSGSGLLPIVGGLQEEQDTTAPEVSCEQPDGDWHGSNVELACSASDGGSGLADLADASFTLGTTVIEGVETAEAATGTREVCDAADNCATAGPFGGLKIDRRSPGVHYVGNAGVYEADEQVEIHCVAADAGSGIAASTCADAVGPAYSFAPGLNTLSASATDAVGNVGFGSASFEVVLTYGSLGRLVDRFVVGAGVAASLKAKLDAAEAARTQGARNGQLGAFVAHVRAQSGKAIAAEHAIVLEELAAALRG